MGQWGRGDLTAIETARAATWFVYLVQAGRGQLYTGISTDPERRLREHSAGGKGARALRGKGPLALVFQRAVGNRSKASVLEARIKKLSRMRKLQLISGELNWETLMADA